MGVLPRPDIPPGAHRDLVDALHDLHHRAGWPSLRRLAAAAGCSHTTVSKAFSGPTLPTWGLLELLVEAMDGDTTRFHELWLAASVPSSVGGSSSPASSVPRIAGRRAELAAVRRHLGTGTGLLLVTGEAGIGKTKLVTTAAGMADRLVAVGHCLPLSAEVPLMPVADLLRTIHDRDRGKRLGDALAASPPYVRESVSLLLPELADGSASATDEFSRQRLFSAVGTCLSRLHSTDPIALLVEDLHWGDSATLDLLEHLVALELAVPMVGTWRLDDVETREQQRDWWMRMRRRPDVTVLELAALTREQTAEQCRLLVPGMDDEAVDRVHRRSRGQPLFTEQLAAHSDTEDELPTLLKDLLDRRLDRLDDAAQVVTRALGVADRALPTDVLASVTGLDDPGLTQGLRVLSSRRLLSTASAAADVQLRHPLLAEAVRRRLLAGEAAAMHRRLAVALAAQTGADAAEVAQHWQGAHDRERELDCRILAARQAGGRFAAGEEAEQWIRALELWPASGAPVAGLTRARAFVAAIDSLKSSLQFVRAARTCDEAVRAADRSHAEDWAAILVRAADFRSQLDGPSVGLGLIEQAIAIYATLPASTDSVMAHERHHIICLLLQRFDEALAAARTAVADATELADPRLVRRALGRLSAAQTEMGDLAQARLSLRTALDLLPPGDDPRSDIWLGVVETDLLLRTGAGAAAVEAASVRGLAAASAWHMDVDHGVNLIRSNVAVALVEAGCVDRAAALIDPLTPTHFDIDRWPIHLARVQIDLCRGRFDDAARVLGDLGGELARGSLLMRVDLAVLEAGLELLRHRPADALEIAGPLLEEASRPYGAVPLAQIFVLAARAAADLVQGEPPGGPRRREQLDLLRGARSRACVDPFTVGILPSTHGAMWQVELRRVACQDSTEDWTRVAAEWDAIRRPHEAAYCRWRAGQAALREGRGTVVARLLERAAHDAREHVPLTEAIAATATSPVLSSGGSRAVRGR